MVLPCAFNTSNGNYFEFGCCVSNERKAKGVKAIMKLGLLGIEPKEFIFVNSDKLKIFYTCILGMLKAAVSGNSLIRTIELPSIKLDEHIGVFIANPEGCLITIKSKHITTRDDEFKTTDIIELTVDNLRVLLEVMSKVMYEEEDE